MSGNASFSAEVAHLELEPPSSTTPTEPKIRGSFECDSLKVEKRDVGPPSAVGGPEPVFLCNLQFSMSELAIRKLGRPRKKVRGTAK